MLKKFSKYFPQIIAMLFLAGFVAYAWTEPPSVPPTGNVEAPINVGSASQYKSGALGIGGVFRAFSDATFDNNVCVGGVCKNIWPAGGAGESVMYLRSRKDNPSYPDPAQCPGGWSQADFQQEIASNWTNAVRTCYRTNSVCQTMYLRIRNDSLPFGQPALCPGGWTQADYQQEVVSGWTNGVRTCYRCN